MYYVHEVVIVSVLFQVAIVIERPSDGPYFHDFKLVTTILKSTVAASLHAEVVFAPKVGLETFRWDTPDVLMSAAFASGALVWFRYGLLLLFLGCLFLLFLLLRFVYLLF